MYSEKVYRRLLDVYPRGHRREYGELMVQLFRDRMRRDGDGFQALVVWMHMILDLVVAAFKEHKERQSMTRRRWIGIALVVVLLAGVVGTAGVNALLSQPEYSGGGVVWYGTGFRSFQTDREAGSNWLAGAMRLVVEDGVINQEVAAEIVRAYEDFKALHVGTPVPQKNERGLTVSATIRSETFTGTEPDEVAEAIRQAVEEGTIHRDEAAPLLLDLDGGLPLGMWLYFSLAGTYELTQVMEHAIREGIISRETAYRILRSQVVHSFSASPEQSWNRFVESRPGSMMHRSH